MPKLPKGNYRAKEMAYYCSECDKTFVSKQFFEQHLKQRKCYHRTTILMQKALPNFVELGNPKPQYTMLNALQDDISEIEHQEYSSEQLELDTNLGIEDWVN